MLAEALVMARSWRQTPPEFRPQLAGAVGLWARGTRQMRAWAPHLANRRGLIDTTIDDIRRRRTVVVLGSGPLFDLPLESLARTFKRVILVDQAHLATIRPRTRRYPNVTLAWRDLSPATVPEPLAFLDEIEDLDWVLSTSLVSQLARAAPEGEERRVVESHLGALAELRCAVTLISDIDYRVFNRHGVVRESQDLWWGREVPRSGLRWKWEVAPFGEEARDARRVHTVAAWADWTSAAAIEVPPPGRRK
jgi:hypothetical protein